MGEHKHKIGPPKSAGPRDESKDRVTVWIPMVREHRTKLREIHREMVRQNPRTVTDDRVFAAMTFGSMIEVMHAQVFPKLVQQPGAILPATAGLPDGTRPLGPLPLGQVPGPADARRGAQSHVEPCRATFRPVAVP